jgi:hypothetical protein
VSSEICTLMYKQRRNYRYLKQTSEPQRSQNCAHFSRIVNSFVRERGHWTWYYLQVLFCTQIGLKPVLTSYWMIFLDLCIPLICNIRASFRRLIIHFNYVDQQFFLYRYLLCIYLFLVLSNLVSFLLLECSRHIILILYFWFI